MRRALWVVPFLVLAGCGWERKLVFDSPAGDSHIELQQPFPANGWGLRILLKSAGREVSLYEMRGDVFLDFAEVQWQRSGEKVAVFTCGTPGVRLAYDIAGNRFLDFDSMRTAVASRIVEQYHPSSAGLGEDAVLEWACSDEGKSAFLRRHRSAAAR